MKRFLKSAWAGLFLGALLVLGGCAVSSIPAPEPAPAPEEPMPAARGDVTVIFTNDVHTYVNNTATDEDGTVRKLLSYGSVAALRDELSARGEHVLLVDAGDHVQGTAFGALDEGRAIIDIMNAVGYQAATPGNHEFDYGQFRAFDIFDQAAFPYISCNFYSVADGAPVLPSCAVLDAGGVKVAFIGITSPETMTDAAPATFQDETGAYIYGIWGGPDGTELYANVQAVVNEARKQADYVVALGHLGVDASVEPYTSRDVIAHTTGLDAFIDAHSHSTVEEEVSDAEGCPVLLVQAGSYFSAIGVMRLSDSGVTAELVTDYDGTDARIDAMVADLVDGVTGQLGEVIAVADAPLYIMDASNPGVRLVRRAETNLGDWVADGFYWYFNEIEGLNCDIALQNGGGIRTDVAARPLSYLTVKTVEPFGNVVCMMKMTGADVLDMLEWSCASVGVVGSDGRPAENGGFLQMAGIRFTVDTSVPSTVRSDEKGNWAGSPTGAYRVCDVMVYHRQTGAWVPLEPAGEYTVAGINYILRNGGNGYAMFDDRGLVKDYVGEEYVISSAYAKAFAVGEDGLPHISSAGSPLASYTGYLLDYENPAGAGRITVK